MPKEMLNLLTQDEQSRLTHISVDLFTSGKQIADAFVTANVKADYVFFYAYMEPKSTKSAMDPAMAKGLIKVNGPMFDNFLEALPLAGIAPRRILLQTGGKNYGMHFGRVRTPLVESDPQPRDLVTNFYYVQEDSLREFCRQHPETGWNMLRPAGVVGSSSKSPLNTFLPFGIYAAVQAHKGEPLIFGGDFESWQFEAVHSTAWLTGYLGEWAVLEDACRNEAFNAQDGAGLSWDRFFKELARWFGVEKGVVPPSSDLGETNDMVLAGGKDCPLRYGPPKVMRRKFTLRDWAGDEANERAWKDITERSNGQLTFNPWEADVDSFFAGDFAYLSFGQLSSNKTRMLGFSGFVDTLESVHESYREYAQFGMLPPLVVDHARPLV